MMQSILSDFIEETTIPQKQHESHWVSQKEELTMELSSEAPSSARNEEMSKRELGKLKKLRDQYLQTAKSSKSPREIIFAVKFVRSLEPQIERLEREVVQ